MQTYSLSVKNRFAIIAFVLLALGLGAALLVVGFALLAGVILAGGVLGTGLAIYRKLTGRRGSMLQQPARTTGLDPALEVFPEPRAIHDKVQDTR